jgi:hypothetical protein
MKVSFATLGQFLFGVSEYSRARAAEDFLDALSKLRKAPNDTSVLALLDRSLRELEENGVPKNGVRGYSAEAIRQMMRAFERLERASGALDAQNSRSGWVR